MRMLNRITWDEEYIVEVGEGGGEVREGEFAEGEGCAKES